MQPHRWQLLANSDMYLTRLWKGSRPSSSNSYLRGSASHLVIRTTSGLEFLALSSGLAHTRLELPERRGATYFFHQASQQLAVLFQYSVLRVKSNSANEPLQDYSDSDSYSKSEPSKTLDCGARAVLLNNPDEVVFSASGLCDSGLTGWQDVRIEREEIRYGGQVYLEDEAKIVPPLVLPKRVSRSYGIRGFVEHLLGAAAGQASLASDYLLLFSDGYLSSYSLSELANWHVSFQRL